MANKVPQYADIELHFDDITYNLDPETVDLDAVDDIILAVSVSTPTAEPIVVLKYTEEPSVFTIDNTAKTVEVKLTSSQLNSSALGKFYTNLWIVVAGRYATHLTKSFDVVPAVRYN